MQCDKCEAGKWRTAGNMLDFCQDFTLSREEELYHFEAKVAKAINRRMIVAEARPRGRH